MDLSVVLSVVLTDGIRDRDRVRNLGNALLITVIMWVRLTEDIK